MSEDNQNQIEQAVMQLLKERGEGKTICPSEAARVMAKLEGHPDRWRDWLELARATAIKMTKQGVVVMFQRGKRVNPDTVKGAIRLGLP